MPLSKWKIPIRKTYMKDSWIQDLSTFLEDIPQDDHNIRLNFEKQLADYCNCKYAIAVNSGTNAILLGLMSLRLKKGDKIVGPSYGYIAWANCCRFLDLKPIMLDVRKDNFCLDEKLLNDYLNDHPDEVKAVCYINHAGYTGPQLEEVIKICDQKNVFLLEDSCQAIGQWYNGVPAGKNGDIGFLSFSTPKLLTCGEGGAILTDNEAIYLKCRDLSFQGGWYDDPPHSRLTSGLNFVMSPQNAYFLSKQLDDIDSLLDSRDRVCFFYESLGYNMKRFHQAPSFFEYYATNPLKLIKTATQFGIQFLYKFYVPLGHLFNSENIEVPISKDLEQHIVQLPNSLTLTRADVDTITKIIKLGDR